MGILCRSLGLLLICFDPYLWVRAINLNICFQLHITFLNLFPSWLNLTSPSSTLRSSQFDYQEQLCIPTHLNCPYSHRIGLAIRTLIN